MLLVEENDISVTYLETSNIWVTVDAYNLTKFSNCPSENNVIKMQNIVLVFLLMNKHYTLSEGMIYTTERIIFHGLIWI